MNEWVAFERVFGPITVQERIDAAGAIGAWASVAAQGSKARVDEFLPRWDDASRSGGPQDVEAIISTMRSIQQRGKQKRNG